MSTKPRKIKIIEIEQCSGAESKMRDKNQTFDNLAKIYPHFIRKVDLSEKPAWGKGWGWYKKGKNNTFVLIAQNWDTSG